MANLNFPSTTGQPTDGSFQFVANNGVTYTWDGDKWEANTSSSLNAMYVQVAGDNMTGDLTLGTDKITLSASSRSEFKEGLQWGPDYNNQNGSALLPNGWINIRQPSGTSGDSVVLRTQIDAVRTSEIQANGTRIIGGTLPSAPNISLKADGSAEFKGFVNIGSPSHTGIGEQASNNSGILPSLWLQNHASPGPLLHGYSSGEKTVEINNDGSAEFAGSIVIDSNISNPDLNCLEINSQESTGGAGSQKWRCQANGSTTQKGNINAPNMTLFLAPENPDNYATTTETYEVDGEEQTTENQTYIGPTLDVKDRLTKTDAALQSLKAALVTTTDHASLKAALIAALADI